tara:strand:- start:1333 stop:1770 length:438 start_codon:yes stop_codon:yes gene_type:complete
MANDLNETANLIETFKPVEINGEQTSKLMSDASSRDENGQSEYTRYFDKTMAEGSSYEVKELKRIIRKKFQVLIKEKATQKVLLGESWKTKLITLKKINKPMVENPVRPDYPNKKYVSNFYEDDLGSYRYIIENRKSRGNIGFCR